MARTPLTPPGSGLGLVDRGDIQVLFDALNGSPALDTANAADTTVGAATLTAAAVVGGVITRSGSTAAYSDTTPTPAHLIAAIGGNPSLPTSWTLTIRNTVAFPQTIVGGTGVTVSGNAIVPPLATGTFLVTVTSATAATVVGLGSQSASNLPATKFTLVTSGTGTAAAGNLSGADRTNINYSGQAAISITTRTGTEMFGDTPNAQIGQSYLLHVNNANSDVLTLVAGSGVTITGTATLATNSTRDFVVTFTSATAVTLQSVGTGTTS